MRKITKIQSLGLIKTTLDETHALQKKALEKLSGSTFPYPKQQKAFHEILIRSYYIVLSTNKFWLDFEKNMFFKFPIAILLRSGISDFISLCHLAEYRRDEQKFMIEYDRLNQNFYKWITKGIDNLTEAEKENQYDFLVQQFPFKFDELGKPIKVKTIGPDEMTKSVEGGEFAEYAEAYKFYKVLSQYEHYSEISTRMMQRDIKYDLMDFMVSIHMIMLGTYFNFQWLGVGSSLIEEMKVLFEKFDKELVEVE